MPSADTLDRVKNIVRQSLKIGTDAAMDDDMPLMGGDYDFDSLDVLLIITNIEREFGIKIADRDMAPQIFTNARSLAEFVETQRG